MKKFFLLIIILIIIIFSAQYIDNTENDTSIDNRNPVTENPEVTLYFSNKNLKLVKEERKITLHQGERIEERVIEELIKGPNSEELLSIIPDQTKVHSVVVQNGTAIVNLSKEFITQYYGGSAAEKITIYSIVHTLTDLININKVKFLVFVDGEKRKVFNHMDIEQEFKRDESLIAK